MKLRVLFTILGPVGFFTGILGVIYFISRNETIGVGGTIIGVLVSLFGALASFAFISLSNVMEQNEKQQSEIDAIKKYIKSKEDSEEFLKEIDEIETKYTKK